MSTKRIKSELCLLVSSNEQAPVYRMVSPPAASTVTKLVRLLSFFHSVSDSSHLLSPPSSSLNFLTMSWPLESTRLMNEYMDFLTFECSHELYVYANTLDMFVCTATYVLWQVLISHIHPGIKILHRSWTVDIFVPMSILLQPIRTITLSMCPWVVRIFTIMMRYKSTYLRAAHRSIQDTK